MTVKRLQLSMKLKTPMQVLTPPPPSPISDTNGDASSRADVLSHAACPGSQSGFSRGRLRVPNRRTSPTISTSGACPMMVACKSELVPAGATFGTRQTIPLPGILTGAFLFSPQSNRPKRHKGAQRRYAGHREGGSHPGEPSSHVSAAISACEHRSRPGIADCARRGLALHVLGGHD